MYTIQFTNGTQLNGLQRLNKSTFEVESEAALNHLLTDANLQLAILLDEDGQLIDIYIDYTMQSCFFQNNVFHFRIAEIAELERQEQHRLEKEKRGKKRWH